MKGLITKHIGTIITTIVLFSGIVASYSVLQYRVTKLEDRPIAVINIETIDERINMQLDKYKELFEKDIQYLKAEQLDLREQVQQIYNLLVIKHPYKLSTPPQINTK